MCRLLPVFIMSPAWPGLATPTSRVMAGDLGLEIINSQFKSNLHGLGPGKNNRLSFSHNYFIWPQCSSCPPAHRLIHSALNTPLGWSSDQEAACCKCLHHLVIMQSYIYIYVCKCSSRKHAPVPTLPILVRLEPQLSWSHLLQ